MTIALILRQCLRRRARTGCLVTPDRRIGAAGEGGAQALEHRNRRFGGRAAGRFGGASLLNLLIEAARRASRRPCWHCCAMTCCWRGAGDRSSRRASRTRAAPHAATVPPPLSEHSRSLRPRAAKTRDQRITDCQAASRTGTGPWPTAMARRLSAVARAAAPRVPQTCRAPRRGWLRPARQMAGEAFWQGEAGESCRCLSTLLQRSQRAGICRPASTTALRLPRHWLAGHAVRRAGACRIRGCPISRPARSAAACAPT